MRHHLSRQAVTFVVQIGLCLGSWFLTSPLLGDEAQDSAAIRSTITAYVDAYNSHDVKKIASILADDASLVDVTGEAIEGKESVVAALTEGFAEPTTYQLSGTVSEIRFIHPDIAKVEGDSRLESAKEATIATKFVSLLRRNGSDWSIVEMRDYPAASDDVKPHERLREFEWMVGNWVDESDNAKVMSDVSWGPGKGFLMRNYTVQVGSEAASHGLMIIGWDPLHAQVKSWVFTSEGSLGEGYWTRSDKNQWIVKVEGTTRDGSPNSATQIVTLVNPDAVRTSSLDRIIAGEIAPDIEDVMMVRKSPSPSGESAEKP